jgi:hypothetical protein
LLNGWSEPIGALPAEERLLLLCARTPLQGQPRAAAGALLAGGLDWQRLLRLAADRHGLLPLLRLHLTALDGACLPPEFRRRLEQAFAAVAARNMFLTAELRRLLAALDQAGLAAVPLKGPVAAATLYDHVTLRPFNDLDILVLPEETTAVAAVLADHGYRPAADLASRPYHYNQPFWKSVPAVKVEVHWSFTRRHFHLPLDLRRLLPRLEPLLLAGQPVRVLSAEDDLLIACIHLAKHALSGPLRLKWVADIGQLLRRRPALNWPALQAEATRLDALRPLYLGLGAAHWWLDAPLPPPVADRLAADATAGRIAGQVGRRLFRPEFEAAGRRERLRLRWRLRRRWPNAARDSFWLAWRSLGDRLGRRPAGPAFMDDGEEVDGHG